MARRTYSRRKSSRTRSYSGRSRSGSRRGGSRRPYRSGATRSRQSGTIRLVIETQGPGTGAARPGTIIRDPETGGFARVGEPANEKPRF